MLVGSVCTQAHELWGGTVTFLPGRLVSKLADVLVVGVFGLTASYPLLFEDLMSKLMVLLIVGVAGFEPTTSSSRTKRATKLRHTPCAAGDSIASTHRGEEIGSAESSVTSAFAPRGNPVGPR